MIFGLLSLIKLLVFELLFVVKDVNPDRRLEYNYKTPRSSHVPVRHDAATCLDNAETLSLLNYNT